MDVYFISFLAVFLAEIGDKTQLVTLTLSCRYPPRRVLAGALSALAVITGLAVILGDFLAALIPERVTIIGAAVFFIAAGIFLFIRKEAKEDDVKGHDRQIALKTFLLVFFAELGDKTQLTAIALTAAYGRPLPVFLGAMTGHLLNHGAAACLGSRFMKLLPVTTVRVLSALMFIFFGALILFSAL